MTDEELLREARDPDTGSGRLAELLGWSVDMPTVKGGMRLQIAVCEAVLGNPSTPFMHLRGQLTRRRPDRYMLAAWSNPLMSAVLMSEPLPVYEDAAYRLLRWVQGETPVRTAGETLAALVAETEARTANETTSEARRVAHRLATLFGLPWPTK